MRPPLVRGPCQARADFGVKALKEELDQYGSPEIVDTDQGCQFTGAAWVTTLTEAGVKVSKDSRGHYLNNIFIERQWRSYKQEAIYLEELTDGFKARRVIKDWITIDNSERPNSSLGHTTPD